MIPKVELEQESVEGVLPVVTKRDPPQDHFDALGQFAHHDRGFGIATGPVARTLREGRVQLPRIVGGKSPFDRSPVGVAPDLVAKDVLGDPADIDLECLLPSSGETADHPASVGKKTLHDVLGKIVQGAGVQAPVSREPRRQHDSDEIPAAPEQDSPQGVIRTRRYEAAKQFPGVHERWGRGSLVGCPRLRTRPLEE